ncbi:TPA: glycosyltransferase family 25 protein [Photobacterium damselae]
MNQVPIYIVSLSDAIERRTKISKALDDIGCSYEFIDAIRGGNIDDEEIKKYNNFSYYNRNIAANEIGCTLSHQKIYKLMMLRNESKAIILEDDVILGDQFKKLLQSNFSIDDESLYILGGQEGLISLDMQQFSIWRKLNISEVEFKKSIKSERYIYRTCCYMLSKELARKMNNLHRIKFYLADDWAFLKKERIIKRIYMANVVSHPLDLTGSTIESDRAKIKSEKSFKKTKLYSSLRIIKVFVRKLYSLGG